MILGLSKPAKSEHKKVPKKLKNQKTGKSKKKEAILTKNDDFGKLSKFLKTKNGRNTEN